LSEPALGDRHVDALARLFRAHPVWLEAARHVADDSTSRVLFTHRPGERWHLARERGETVLRPGDVPEPDLVFRFSPESIDRLAAVEGPVGAFAVELFGLIAGDDPRARVELRVAAPFQRLVRRGYLRLLVASGGRAVAFGLRHGVRSLAGLQRLVESLARRSPAAWEDEGGGDPDAGLRPSAR
jgi:hypothetical protein